MNDSPELINNRYRVVRGLGKGGFGATFLVEDTQLPSGKRFVLKELMPIEHDPQTYTLVKQRFEREAVILEELGGLTTQIPSLYAYFTEAGKFYLVQEYVEGETIAQKVMVQGVMSDAAVRDWLIGLLPVLSVVHDRQIIHRDIKPENIILQQRDHTPVLIDFGAVRETMGMKLTPQEQSTQSIVIGTPGYMPSEQAAGRAMFSSDLYSLGMTAIYALTGKIPQELPTDPMTGEVQWRSYAPSVSNGLARILDRAIASHSRDRFATAQAMRLALDSGFISGTVVSGASTPMQTPIPTQVSGAYPVNQTPVYPVANSQIRTVVTAHPQSAYPAQTGYVNPMQAPQSAGSDPKTWLMAIGVGAFVTLAGVGIYVMLREKDPAATVAKTPVPAVVSPIASPPVSIAPSVAAPVVAAPVAVAPVATPVAIAPASVAAPVEIQSNPPSQRPSVPVSYPVKTTQVSFDEGSTGSTIRSSGRSGETHRYTLNCGSGQQMKVYPSSGEVQVMIKTPGGESLGSASAGSPWRGRLPATGDYAIEVTTTTDSSYVVSIEVN